MGHVTEELIQIHRSFWGGLSMTSGKYRFHSSRAAAVGRH